MSFDFDIFDAPWAHSLHHIDLISHLASCGSSFVFGNSCFKLLVELFLFRVLFFQLLLKLIFGLLLLDPEKLDHLLGGFLRDYKLRNTHLIFGVHDSIQLLILVLGTILFIINSRHRHLVGGILILLFVVSLCELGVNNS